MATSKKISSDFIFDGHTFLKNHVLIVEQAKVLECIPIEEHHQNIQFYKGILTPGFINTHCHLELSHLKGRVDTGTSLLPFLQQVVQFRDIDQDVIDQAIQSADTYMWERGIHAVGDISNQTDTINVKKASHIHYHTFVEMFDFMQSSLTQSMVEQYTQVYNTFNQHKLNVSAVPHAPYTVTKELFKAINKINRDQTIVSIHNQETPHENAYFMDKSGDFSKFFKSFGIDDAAFRPMRKRSINYALDHLDLKHTHFFVHNTTTNASDIDAATQKIAKPVWVTCPNANLYIENTLPNYKMFLDHSAFMTIGTDSLTSNWQLDIWEEIKTIGRYNSYIPLETLLTWGTKNGAEALGLSDDMGTFKKNTSPGIVLLEDASPTEFLKSNATRVV